MAYLAFCWRWPWAWPKYRRRPPPLFYTPFSNTLLMNMFHVKTECIARKIWTGADRCVTALRRALQFGGCDSEYFELVGYGQNRVKIIDPKVKTLLRFLQYSLYFAKNPVPTMHLFKYLSQEHLRNGRCCRQGLKSLKKTNIYLSQINFYLT